MEKSKKQTKGQEKIIRVIKKSSRTVVQTPFEAGIWNKMGNKIPILEHSTTLLQANHLSNVCTHNSGNQAKKMRAFMTSVMPKKCLKPKTY